MSLNSRRKRTIIPYNHVNATHVNKRRKDGFIMKRKFLEDLGIEKDIVDKIMAENGIDITREQTVTNGYKKQLDDALTKLKNFEGVDVTELQDKIAALNNELASTKTSYESEIETMKFTTALESKISAMGPKNTKTVMALLDTESLKSSKNQDADITAALEKIKSENDYLFEASVSTPRVVAATSTTTVENSDKKAAANEAFRALLKNE